MAIPIIQGIIEEISSKSSISNSFSHLFGLTNIKILRIFPKHKERDGTNPNGTVEARNSMHDVGSASRQRHVYLLAASHLAFLSRESNFISTSSMYPSSIAIPADPVCGS